MGVFVLADDKKSRLEQARDLMTNPQARPDTDGEVHITSFGKVRYDSDNPVTFTGEYEEDMRTRLKKQDFSWIKRKLLIEQLERDQEAKKLAETQEKESAECSAQLPSLTSFTDEHDYQKTSRRKQDLVDLESFKKYARSSPKSQPLKSIKFAFVDEWQRFKLMRPPKSDPNAKLYKDFIKQDPNILEMITFAADSPLRSPDEVAMEIRRATMTEGESEVLQDDTEEGESNEEVNLESIQRPPEELQETVASEMPKTALEYIQKLRQGLIQPANTKIVQKMDQKYKKLGSSLSFKKWGRSAFDSKGFRIYKHVTPNLFHFRRDEVLRDLENRIIFNDRDIVAIDKPYGLIVAGATGKSQDHINLESYLPDLAKLLRSENLYRIHRIDRDSTGVVLLAKTESMASTLKAMFQERKVIKYYWALLKNGVHPLRATIDVPLELTTVGGKERMGLRPYCDEEFNRTMKPSSKVYSAVTHYRVLRQKQNALMVEVRPEQGIKHQIRAHLGLALRAPILGDHKYSYLDRIAPQRLPEDMLTALKIRQAKVRTIPMHLHAKLIILPELGRNGQNIFVSAHLPGFFANTMSLLGLTSSDTVVKKSEVE